MELEVVLFKSKVSVQSIPHWKLTTPFKVCKEITGNGDEILVIRGADLYWYAYVRILSFADTKTTTEAWRIAEGLRDMANLKYGN